HRSSLPREVLRPLGPAEGRGSRRGVHHGRGVPPPGRGDRKEENGGSGGEEGRLGRAPRKERPMFDQMLETRTGRSGDRTRWAFPIAVAVHVLAIGAIIAGSYVIVEAVQDHDLMISVIGGAPTAPPPPPPPPPPAAHKAETKPKVE